MTEGCVTFSAMLSTDAVVERLYLKEQRGAPMSGRSQLDFVAREGITGDLHRHRLGPRQVLMAASEVLDDLDLSPDALRANVITRGIPLDDLESGTVLSLGEATVRLTHRCEVCSHLGRLSGIDDLKSLNGRRGYLAVILSGGTVPLGASLGLHGVHYNHVPDHVGTRTLWVIRQIPEGRVVPYPTLIQLAGAPRGYLRALPRLVAQADARGLPAHRVVTMTGALLDYIPQQLERLRREGTECGAEGVTALKRRTWQPTGLFLQRARAPRAAGQRSMKLPAAA